MARLIYKKDIIENSPAVVSNRIRLTTGALPLQVDIDSILVRVTDMTDGTAIGTDISIDDVSTPSIADVIFNTLQTTDIRYDGEDTLDVDGETVISGYNFLLTIPGTYFPKGGRTYHVDILFTPAAAGAPPFIVIWQLRTVNTYILDVVEADE